MDFSTAVSPQITRALSNTFIYSLWQGLILAAIAGLIILVTQKSASRRRYNLLVASLVLFFFGVVSTFFYQLQMSSTRDGASQTSVAAQPVSTAEQIIINLSATPPERPHSFLDYINTYAGSIVLIWFLIVCARCVQLLTGLHGLHRLRHQSTSRVDAAWEQRIQTLSAAMGITQLVQIAESGLAKVPMVIGHLKPVILIPAGLLTALPPAEIEAILVHELAHIRRRDYLVNMLQHFVEIIFFFNPAVLWVSSLIKAERENCCDDITLSQTSSKAAYIRALISCQEYQLRAPRFAMALGRRKNLLGRVSRMVSSSNHSLSILEKSLLTVCLVTAGIMLAAFSDKGQKKPVQAATTNDQVIITDQSNQPHNKEVCPPDTTPGYKFRIYQPDEVGNGTSLHTTDTKDKKINTTYLFKTTGTLYQINFEDGQLKSLHVGGKTIPAEKWGDYKRTIEKLIRDHDQNEEAAPSEVHEPIEATEAINGAAFDQNSMDQLKKSLVQLQNARLALLDSANQIKAALSNENESHAKEDLKLYGKNGQQNKSNSDYKTSVNAYVPVDADIEIKSYNNNIKIYEPKNEYKGASDLSYQKNGGTVIKTGVQEYKARDQHKEWVTTDALIAAMVKEGLVASPRSVKSFMISNEQMILNGKVLASEIHQLMVKKYVEPGTEKTWSIFYNFDTSTIKTTTRSIVITD